MEKLSNFFKRPAVKLPPPPKYPWQEVALTIIKTIPDAYTVKKASIFRTCKLNLTAARIALEDCKELEKNHINYYFKVWNVIHNKQKVN